MIVKFEWGWLIEKTYTRLTLLMRDKSQLTNE